MDMNEFAQEVHALAVEKGFYDPAPSDAELIAAIHSEISEAFEEWRVSCPMVYHRCTFDGGIYEIKNCGHRHGEDCDTGNKDDKPEGIAVELIDVALRVLDFIAGHGLEVVENDVDTFARDGCMVGADQLSLPRLVLSLHYGAIVSFVHMENGMKDISDCLNAILGAVFAWLSANDIYPEPLLLEKHEYNKTRPYKHGGKRV